VNFASAIEKDRKTSLEPPGSWLISSFSGARFISMRHFDNSGLRRRAAIPMYGRLVSVAVMAHFRRTKMAEFARCGTHFP
jgi:hypothetical protein